MKKSTQFILATVILISVGFSMYLIFTEKNIAYFDYNQVYNNCKLKNKLEKDLMKVGNMRKAELDSLQLELTILSNKIGSNKSNQTELDKFEDLKTRFLSYKEKYEQENYQLKETYFTQIRKEINDKSRIFAEQNGIDLLFASTAEGSLLYANEALDVTNDLKAFIDK